MMEIENAAIKLFGKRIRVPLSVDGVYPSPPAMDSAEEEAEGSEDDEETEQDPSEEQAFLNKGKDDEELTSPDGGSAADSVNPKTPSIDEGTSKSKPSNSGKDSEDSPKSQEKPALKKPDKILPCPRCNSMDTKFCYYNNYNVNQPRHFCKACQRYWTAGGTMRNVPVGAGRRKSKSSASRYGHISLSEALQAAARVDSPNGRHHHYPNLTPNATVLTFGLNHYDPMPSPVGKRARPQNNSHCSEPEGAATNRDGGNLPNEHSTSNLNGIAQQAPCLNSVPWPYGIPMPFYPPAFWTCGNVGIPGGWNFPMLSHPNLISGPNSLSPILGKHPREADMIKADNLEERHPPKPKRNGSVLIPKTLRIDDPDEAAKSSIWATLGIKNECGAKGGLFRGFQPMGKDKEDRVAETETEKRRAMWANPAALSRSRNFHEST